MEPADSPTPASPSTLGKAAPGLRWPCVINLPAIAEEGGGIRGRIRASWSASRAVWRGHPSLVRSMLLWTALACVLMGAASFGLGDGARPCTTLWAVVIQGVWTGTWLFLVGIHLGAVRREDGPRLGGLGLPNGLTLLRILLIPATCWTILAHARLTAHGGLVTALVFVVGFTDVLDGLLARLLGLQTVLGRNLDHMADVLICSALALAQHMAGLMPLWLASLYLVRYLGAGAAGILGMAIRPNLRITPSLTGRIGTLVAGSTLFLTIARPLVAPGLAAEVRLLHIFTAAVIGLNMLALVVMTLRGTAFERKGQA